MGTPAGTLMGPPPDGEIGRRGRGGLGERDGPKGWIRFGEGKREGKREGRAFLMNSIPNNYYHQGIKSVILLVKI